MGSNEILDFETLLAPIPGDNPCGESLRWDPLWDEIRKARQERSDAVDENEDIEADWRAVYSLTTQALANRSKDLMVAGWLTESLVQQHGFAGLRDGLQLIQGLVDQYWDGLHPQIEDEGDLEVRGGPLVWLTDRDTGARMPTLLRAVVPLAQSNNETEVLSWAFANFGGMGPQRDDESEESYNRRKAEYESRKQRFEAAVAATPGAFYTSLAEDLVECKKLVTELSNNLDDKLKDHAPGWSGLREALQEVEITVHSALRRKNLPLPGEVTNELPVEGDDGAEAESDGRHSGTGRGPIRSRAEAIARLQECADYLRHNEPHSLVASLVHRAVVWANMPLEKVLDDLIKDKGVLGEIGEVLGLHSNESDGE